MNLIKQFYFVLLLYNIFKSVYLVFIAIKSLFRTGGPNISRRQERALNIETFGSNAGYYRRGGYRGRGGSRGRGRGRGRGGAGGGISSNRGRGSYSRGNSSSRSWVDYDFDYEAAGIKSRNPPKTS